MFASRGGFQGAESAFSGNVRIVIGYDTPYGGRPGLGNPTINPFTTTLMIPIGGNLPGNATDINNYYGGAAAGNFSNCNFVVQSYAMENQSGYTIITSTDGGQNYNFNNTFPGGNLTVGNIQGFVYSTVIPSMNRVLLGTYIDSGGSNGVAANNMFISDDLCQTFTSVNPGLQGQPTYVNLYANNTVICAGSSRVGKSTDNGNTWTSIDLGAGYFFQGIAYGANTWVIAGGSGGPSYSGPNILYSTDNGNTWTPIVVGNSSNFWGKVAYGNGKFVAQSWNTVDDNLYAYSSDGINWTTAASPTGIDQGNLGELVYGANNFYMFSSNLAGPSNQVQPYAVSSDGINWTYYQTNYPRPKDPIILAV